MSLIMPLLRLGAVFLLLLSPLHLIAQAPPPPIVMDFSDPAEATRWTLSSHDNEAGPGGFQNGAYVVSSGPNAPAMLERNLVVDASQYNRLIADVTIDSNATGASTGFVGMAFFLYDPAGLVIPDSRIIVNAPIGVRTLVAIRLDQSVFWRGTITRIRLDPIWGVGTARLHSVTIDREPPPNPAPKYDFRNAESRLGWMTGEFGLQGEGFVARPTSNTADGISYTTQGPMQVLQHLNLSLNADLITHAELTFRHNNGTPSVSRLFWATPENLMADNARSIEVPSPGGTDWQTVRFNLAQHPLWKGNISYLILNPTVQSGTITLRSLDFHGREGLGERGQSDSLITWRTHQEVGNELAAGNYRPLLVLVTSDDNAFSKRIELELAGNRNFVQRAGAFHSIRMQYNDPATARVFPDIFRLPMLATMTYDFNRRQWDVKERLMGPDVSATCLAIMDKTLAGR